MKPIEEYIIAILGNETLSQKEVCKRLLTEYGVDISSRWLREYYESIRQRFANKEINFTILHNANGNYISYDFNAIKKDNVACRRTAYAILKNAYARDKRIMNDDQLSFFDYLRMIEGEDYGERC